MVGFSKLLIGAFLPSAYGKAQVAALKKEETTKITSVECAARNTSNAGYFTPPGSNCKVTHVAPADGDKINIWTDCPDTDDFHQYATVDEVFKMATGASGEMIPVFARSGDQYYVGEASEPMYDFEKDFCVRVHFPGDRTDLLMKFKYGAPSDPVVSPVIVSSQELVGTDGEYVPESAFFGEANGEWSIIDVAFIAVIGVLLLCFCLGLYSCWAQKKKNKEQAEKDCAKLPPAKYNHQLYSRSGVQRRRQLAIE